MLNEFVYQLVCSGQLTMAKSLRIKILEKVNDLLEWPLNALRICFRQIHLFKSQKSQSMNAILPSRAIMTSLPTLIDLKSADIAEQMTLLDAELFKKIEIPEVLIWAQEQCEERSPNLTRFTEHFNKMSYWWVIWVLLVMSTWIEWFLIELLTDFQGTIADIEARR